MHSSLLPELPLKILLPVTLLLNLRCNKIQDLIKILMIIYLENDSLSLLFSLFLKLICFYLDICESLCGSHIWGCVSVKARRGSLKQEVQYAVRC